MSASSNILYFSEHSKVPRALVSNRARLKVKFPTTHRILFTSIPDRVPNRISSSRCEGSIIENDLLEEFLEEHWDYQRIDRSFISPEALLINLPDEFEPALSKLVISIPDLEICIEPRTQHLEECLCWTCYLPGESIASHIHVGYHRLPYIMFPEPHSKSDIGWVPLVMVSGNTVAIGGFVASASLIEGAYAAQKLLSDDSTETLNSSDPNSLRSAIQSMKHSIAACKSEGKSFYTYFTL